MLTLCRSRVAGAPDRGTINCVNGDDDPGNATASRRQRRRPTSPAPLSSQQGVPANPKGVPSTRAGKQPRRRDRDSAGGLRDLVGGGPSHLGVGGALRGRDVNRPTDEDLAEAEQHVVIVRRNWKPDTTG